MIYLLDANVFIQAYRFNYPLDVFPAFWQWLKDKNEEGLICSITAIHNELKVGADTLYEWIRQLDSSKWFLPIDDSNTQQEYAKIADWAMANTHYHEPAKSEFLEGADPWLIAKAKCGDYTIVTQEKSDPKSKRKIHIPDVCENFDVPYCNTIDLIRKLKGVFK